MMSSSRSGSITLLLLLSIALQCIAPARAQTASISADFNVPGGAFGDASTLAPGTWTGGTMHYFLTFNGPNRQGQDIFDDLKNKKPLTNPCTLRASVKSIVGDRRPIVFKFKASPASSNMGGVATPLGVSLTEQGWVDGQQCNVRCGASTVIDFTIIYEGGAGFQRLGSLRIGSPNACPRPSPPAPVPVFGSPIFNCHPTTDGSLRVIGNADLPSGSAYLFVSFGDFQGGSLADTLNAGLPLPCQYRAALTGTSMYSRLSTFQVQLFQSRQASFSVTGMPIQTHGMDNEAQCSSLLRCGSVVKVTVTALNNVNGRWSLSSAPVSGFCPTNACASPPPAAAVVSSPPPPAYVIHQLPIPTPSQTPDATPAPVKLPASPPPPTKRNPSPPPPRKLSAPKARRESSPPPCEHCH